MKENEITNRQIWVGILLVFIMIAGFSISQWLTSRTDTKETIQTLGEKIDSIQKNLSPYQKKDSLKKITIVKDFVNSSKNSKPTNSFKKSLVTTGKIKGGYLYVSALVDKAPLTKYDDVYLRIAGTVNGQYKQLGGHLIQPSNIEIPIGATSTELLMDLSDVRYKVSFTDSNLEVTSGDWLQLINNGNGQFVVGFSSTERAGLIKEISIYYDCVEDGCDISSN